MITKCQIKNEIKALKTKSNTVEKFIENSLYLFKGREVLVVSAGPSAKDWENVYVEIKTRTGQEPVVVCIKQAIELVGNLCDVHFINNWNLIKYTNKADCLSIMTQDNYAPTFGEYDVNFLIDRRLAKPDLSSTLDFDKFTLNSTGKARPVGPGIMYEAVFYTLVHMGFSRVYTIGWDIADEEGKNTHFTLQVPSSISKQSIFSSSKFSWVLHFFRKIIITIPRYYKFEKGKVINSAGMKINEAQKVSASVPSLVEWLKSINIMLEVRGNSKWQ